MIFIKHFSTFRAEQRHFKVKVKLPTLVNYCNVPKPLGGSGVNSQGGQILLQQLRKEGPDCWIQSESEATTARAGTTSIRHKDKGRGETAHEDQVSRAASPSEYSSSNHSWTHSNKDRVKWLLCRSSWSNLRSGQHLILPVITIIIEWTLWFCYHGPTIIHILCMDHQRGDWDQQWCSDFTYSTPPAAVSISEHTDQMH